MSTLSRYLVHFRPFPCATHPSNGPRLLAGEGFAPFRSKIDCGSDSRGSKIVSLSWLSSPMSPSFISIHLFICFIIDLTIHNHFFGLFFPPIVPGFPRNGTAEWLSKELFSTLPQTTPVPSPTPTDTSAQTEAPGFTAHSVGYNFNQHCYSAGEYSFHPVDVYSRGTSWCKVYFKIQTEICSHGSCTNPLWRRRSPSGKLQTNSIFTIMWHKVAENLSLVLVQFFLWSVSFHSRP